MRRSFAMLMLVVLAAGSTLGATCLETCSDRHRSSTPGTGCHHSQQADHRLAGSHDCSTHLTPVAIAAKRLEPVTQLSIPLVGEGHAEFTPAQRHPRPSASESSAARRHPVPVLTPLRI
jgi:hypothetical protein